MRVVFSFCLIYITSAGVVKAAEVLRPRGVPLSKSSFYDPTRDFHCLDGSGTIPFAYVNDDYCDCRDGSDEPGTSACPNGFFNCPNAGHMPLNLPSSRVNDGVCDCCDASDEYASDANCVDTCREMGRAAREDAAKQRQERMKGYELRKSMIEEGRKRKKEAEKSIRERTKEKSNHGRRRRSDDDEARERLQKLKRKRLRKQRSESHSHSNALSSRKARSSRLKRARDNSRSKCKDTKEISNVKMEELKKDKEEAEKIRTEKDEIKKVVEEPEKAALEQYISIEAERKALKEAEQKVRDDAEAREAFAHLDNDGDGLLTVVELQSRQTFDTNRDGEVSLDEAKFYLKQEESIDLDSFITSGWPMMRPVYKHNSRMFIPPTPVPSEEGLEPPPVEFNEENAEVREEEDAELEPLDPELDPEDESEDDEEDDGLDDDFDLNDDPDEGQDDNASEEEEPKYDEETQKLVDAANAARGDFDEADRQVRDLARELRSLEEAQEKDYGPEEEFRVLEGNCYEYTDREYVYRLCPFDKAIQKPKSGHGETRLGQWGEWSGPENNKYSRMLYSNGQACWNGPTRSADVRLYCGTDTQLTSVTEPNRCEYMFMVSTPAVCSKPDDLSGDEGFEHSHTEL